MIVAVHRAAAMVAVAAMTAVFLALGWAMTRELRRIGR